MMVSKLRFFSCLPLWFLTIVIMKLEEIVATYKNSEIGEKKMSSVWKEVEDEGKAKRSSEIARNLLAEKLLSDEKIAQVTKLPLEDVMKIKAEFTAN